MGVNASGGDVFPHRTTVGNAAEVTVAGSHLATFQFGEHVVEPASQLAVGRVRARGDHVCQCREIMAGRVAAEARAFPIAVAGRARFETGLTQERREQAVRLVREQVSLVGLHRFRERTV